MLCKFELPIDIYSSASSASNLKMTRCPAHCNGSESGEAEGIAAVSSHCTISHFRMRSGSLILYKFAPLEVSSSQLLKVALQCPAPCIVLSSSSNVHRQRKNITLTFSPTLLLPGPTYRPRHYCKEYCRSILWPWTCKHCLTQPTCPQIGSPVLQNQVASSSCWWGMSPGLFQPWYHVHTWFGKALVRQLHQTVNINLPTV